ncbi:hypothetical protein HXX76_003805 [Chlamydomonas incerta]|uniref:Neurochondrin n=1 Tax=Chlamydomonas incerta TaxID=51695 RepID=A0A835W549_CHLIN|nr:hypothetical protein HXX76_003805 [Chlamydomonas incerta]|eukprot:KAG2440952.1 hypothetical protein HXX76_003805 [Chlamydomonas incerta]
MPEERDGASSSPAAPDWNRSFQQCLELLKGPGDERRFVGLLLVTRLLPQGSDDAVRRVLEALGWTFLQRLLLPLRRQPSAAAPAVAGDAATQQASCVGLALSILAAACRLPDVAAGAEVRESLPLMLRVVRMGGVSPVLTAAGAALPAADPAADAAAVTDALECLVAAAAASPAATCAVLDGADALGAVAEALTRMAAVLTAPASAAAAAAGQGGGEGEGAVLEAAAHNGALLAMSLLERLVAGSAAGAVAPAEGPSGRAVALVAKHPAAAAKAVAALAQLMGNRRLLAGQAKPPGAQTEQPAVNGAAGGDSSAVGGGSTGGGGGGGGAAQLQLEAMYLLLLLLRACHEPAATAASEELRRLDVASAASTLQPQRQQQLQPGSWSAAVRRGLGWLLRSRVPPALKHAAIELAALTVGVVGEPWLLGAGQAQAEAPAGAGARRQAQGQGQGQSQVPDDQPGAFLQLVTEIMKIELGMLLHDAMHPSRPVPAGAAPGGLRSAARGQAAAPQPSQRLLDELAQRAAKLRAEEEAAARKAAEAAVAAGAAETAQRAGGDGAPAALPASGGMSEPGAEAMDVEPGPVGVASAAAGEASVPAAATAATAAATAGGDRMLAGERALLLLPACYSLLESCVGAVAADAAAGDDDGGDAMERDEPPAELRRARPELSDAVLTHAMRTFHEVSDTLLEFFEAAAGAAAAGGEGGGGGGGGGAAPGAAAAAAPGPVAAASETEQVQVPPVLLLGAARVLGRYFAEAPQAMLSDKVLAALPAVMAVRDEGEGEDGTYALPFLLPGLLQATGDGFQGRAEACKALQGAPAALEACAAYLGHCVRRAAAAAAYLDGHLPRPAQQSSGTAVEAEAATVAVVRASPALAAACSEAAAAEAGLADVCMLLCNLLEPAALAAACGRRAGTAGGVADAAWAAVRRTVSGAGPAAAATVEAAATASAAQLSPVLALLQPAVWLVVRWAEARSGTLQALAGMDVLSSTRSGGASSGTGAECAAAQALAAVQLAPRALLCPACLACVAVAATMRRLSDTASASSSSTGSEHGSSTAAGAAAAILPPALLEGVCRLAVAAAAAGASLELASLQRALDASEAWRQTEERLMQQARVQAGSHPPGSGPAAPEVDMGGDGGVPEGVRAGWLTAAAAHADFAGDAVLCWERLLGALAQVVEVSGAARALARAAPAIQGLAAAAVAAQAGGEAAGRRPVGPVSGPARELLLDVNLALLLQVVAVTGP